MWQLSSNVLLATIALMVALLKARPSTTLMSKEKLQAPFINAAMAFCARAAPLVYMINLVLQILTHSRAQQHVSSVLQAASAL
jgi:hypothetical protein